MNKKILDEFKKIQMSGFWGNYFDVRFFIGNYIFKNKSQILLDIACGTGILLSIANSKKKLGVDISLESLLQAKKLNSDLELINADATMLPFQNDIFDRVLGVQIFPDLKRLGIDWKKALDELIRVSNNEIILSGNNRMSKHHNWRTLEDRENYLTYSEQVNLLKKYFKIKGFGYDPHPKWLMYPIKKIILKIPNSVSEKLRMDEIIYTFLRSKRYFKNGRSYLILGYKL